MLIVILLSAIPLALRFGTPAAILFLATVDRYGVDVGMLWKPFYFFWPILIFECVNAYQRQGAPALLRSASARWALLFLIACLFWVGLSVWNTGGEPASVNYFGVVLVLSGFSLTLGFRLGFDKAMRRLLESLPWVGIVVGAWGLAVFGLFLLNPSQTPMADGRVTGIFLDPRFLVPRLCGLAGDPNAWMMQLLPLWAVNWLPVTKGAAAGPRWLARLLLGLNLFMVGSRTGWVLALLVPAVALLLRAARRSRAHLTVITMGLIFLAGVGAVTQFGLMDTELGQHSQARSSIGDSRLALWAGSLDVAMDNPLLGIGPGMIATSDEMRLASGLGTGLQTHNAWLELMVEAGIPAFMFLAIAMAALLSHSFRLIHLRDEETLPLLSITLAFVVILLAEASISYITSATLWVWFFVLLLLQAELTGRWESNVEALGPDPEELAPAPEFSVR